MIGWITVIWIVALLFIWAFFYGASERRDADDRNG